MSEKVKVTVELEKKTYEALEWYIKLTSCWAGEDTKDQAISAWIAQTVRDDLEAEANSRVPEASDFIAEELKGMLHL